MRTSAKAHLNAIANLRSATMWRKILRVGGALIGIASLFAIAHFFGLNRHALYATWASQNFLTLVSSVSLFVFNLFLNAFAFAYLLKIFGDATENKRLVAAYGLSVLAKYVPGSVWQLAGRSIAFGRIGVAGRAIFACSLMEQVLALFLCLFLGCVLDYSNYFPLIFLAFVVAVLLVVVVALFCKRSKAMKVICFEKLITSVILYLTALFFYFGGYWVLFREATGVGVTQFAGSLFLGTAAGFLAVFVPSGIGVREGVTAALNAGPLSADVVSLMLLARATAIVAEVIVFVISLSFVARKK